MAQDASHLCRSQVLDKNVYGTDVTAPGKSPKITVSDNKSTAPAPAHDKHKVFLSLELGLFMDRSEFFFFFLARVLKQIHNMAPTNRK